jgi:hypothetical protein
MTAATRLIPAHIANDLRHAGARLRNARVLHPRHDEKIHHPDCDVCRWKKRLDWLLDQIQEI